MRVIAQPITVMPVVSSPARRIFHEKYQVPAAPAGLVPPTMPESPYAPPLTDCGTESRPLVVAVLLRLLAMAGAVIGGVVVLGIGVALTGGCG